ncbi:MAG: Rpn family recombination-promoting nuclease/putative transposase [Planctomycetes bacterium]|nr:Rpn family recombination-promoting nuclease/putative transposase [Planctomycetota bacterium]
MELIRSHDALFRFVFGDPEHAAELLRVILPKRVAAAVQWDTLRRVPDAFVDAALRERRADVVFEVRMGGATVLLYVLLEHKSVVVRLAAWQQARYVGRIVDAWLAANPGATAIPAVLPILVHHGDEPWNAPRSPRDLVDLTGAAPPVQRWLRRRQLHLPLLVFDLATFDEAAFDALQVAAVASATLRFLQLLRRQAQEAAIERILRWRRILAEVQAHRRGTEWIKALFSWFLAGSPANRETLRTVMSKLHDEDAPMRTNLDLLLEIGEERGLERGRELVRNLVLAQLRARFGELPPAVLAQLQSADASTLQRWGERIVAATSLDAVFAG